MNKILKTLITLTLSAFILTGCQKGEPLNKEADILEFEIEGLGYPAKGIIDQNKGTIEITIRDGSNLEHLTPKIKISDNAEVIPASEVSQNFSNPIEYTVISQDKIYSRKYTVTVSVFSKFYDFEDWVKIGNAYWQPAHYWASGNPGIRILNAVSPIEKRVIYPTTYTDTLADVKSGNKAALMINQKGYGSPAGYMVPGSLFLGNFKTENALQDPLSCPQFGIPIYCTPESKPKSFSFWYKYIPGPNYLNAKGEILADRIDECNIYSIIYEGNETLTPKNILTSDRIIATAMIDDKTAKHEYTYRNIIYNYKREVPMDKPIQIAIVTTSSINGDFYVGAIGSKLVIDDICIHFTDDNDNSENQK